MIQNLQNESSDAPAEASTTEAEVASPERKVRRRGRLGRLWQSSMKLTRRVHLYAGLLMFPWVILYGFTALLFNRSTILPESGTAIHHFKLDEERELLPAAADFAALIVQELNEQQSDAEQPVSYRLVNEDSAAFTREAFGATQNEDSQFTVVMNLASGTGYVRERARTNREESKPEKEEKRTPLAKEPTLKISVGDYQKTVAGTMNETMDALGLDSEDVRFRSLPTIEFDIEENDKVHRVRFGAIRRRGGSSNSRGSSTEQTGRLSVIESGANEVGWRRFLLRLHTAHGYPVQQNARWFWALIVDAMFATMVFWGFSGIFMWWQIKRTRLWGAVCLIVSAVVATWMVIAMHGLMTAG